MRMFVRLVAFFLCFTSVTAHAQTMQSWPQKTVRFIIPLPPGSGMDLSARLIAERLTQSWGQSVVVENRQGADGIPAVTAFLTARDNHTFLFSFAGIVSFNHLLHERFQSAQTAFISQFTLMNELESKLSHLLLQASHSSFQRGKRPCHIRGI